MRTALALALAAALQASSLHARLVHAHPDEHATAHHHGRAVHTHWGGHGPGAVPSGSPALGGEDPDRALFLGAFVAVTVQALPQPGVVPAVVTAPVPAERAARPSMAVAHGHDPPLIPAQPSRAPPALLS